MVLKLRSIITTITITFLLSACSEQSREPIPTIPLGRDTLFEIPQYLKGSEVQLYRTDLNGDGWQDAIVIVRRSSPVTGEGSDSLIVYLFDRTSAHHRLTASYADFGIEDVTVANYPPLKAPSLIVSLYSGGNDALSYGKAILTWRDSTLATIGYAPWGNPSVVVFDSMLVLVIHETFSGMLPHAEAVEYADSLVVVVAFDSTARTYNDLIARYTAHLRAQLDSLALQQRNIRSKDEWYNVVHLIMSIANMEAKVRTAAARRATVEQQLRRWRSIPLHYRALLRDFSQSGEDEFSFIR